jgi:PAS domain S-box-containing protein
MTVSKLSGAGSPPSGSGFRALPPANRERFLAAIVDGADDAIFAKTLDGTILSWNGGAQRMYGHTPEEVVGRHVSILAPTDRYEEIDRLLERIRAGNRIDHFETVRVRKDGSRFPVSLAISPVLDDGKVIGASTVARDITDQRRLAEALTYQRALLAAQSEASIEGILVVDPHGRVIFMNARFTEMWNYSPDVTATASDKALLAAAAELVEDPVGFLDRVHALSEDRYQHARDEIHLRDGRVFDRYSAPVRGEDDLLFGRAWFFRDVTAETIRTAQLQAVIAAVEDAAIVFDAAGRSLIQNPAARRLLPDVRRYQDLSDRFGLADTRDLRSSSWPGRPTFFADAELSLRTSAGTRRMVASTRPIFIEPDDAALAGDQSARHGHLGTLVLLRDITELREAQASREAFVGVLSHELRTPITTIFGAGKLLERSQSDPVRQELLRDIVGESDRLYRLVEDLLVLTRIERDNLALTCGPIRITPIVERVVVAERASNPANTIELEMGSHLPIVSGEETYVEQVLRNLVGNAIKYGPRGGRVQVFVEPTAADGVAVRVLDDGPGIATGERDRIFELLYRSPLTAAQAAGSGIGLFVSRRLADALGGRLSAESRPEGGSEFTLELAPYDEAEPKPTRG